MVRFLSSLELDASILKGPLVFINLIRKLVHTGNRFTSQGSPQSMLVREADFESANGYVFKIAIYFIVHLPISI